MIPGFPLDGGRVLRSIIWGVTDNLDNATRWASYMGQGFGYLLMAFGFALVLAGQLVGGLWMIFIGWFLTGAARSSYQQLMIREALSGVRVEQVMTTDVPVIPADMSVRQFVDDQLLRHEYSCYPVTQGEDIIGVIGAEEVRRVPSSKWNEATVGEVKHDIDMGYEVEEDDDAWEAVTKLTSPEVCRLLVVDEQGHLKGTVGRDAVFRLVQTKIRPSM